MKTLTEVLVNPDPLVSIEAARKIGENIGAISFAIAVDAFDQPHIPKGYYEPEDVVYGFDDEAAWYLAERLAHGGHVIHHEDLTPFIG
jgi:hypothetical protein